jgi:probable phosphoglycerate mutase
VSRLLLVRHGQSTWNAEGRWQGRADPPLSELGERQAADVVVVLRARAANATLVERIWASPLVRARRTAEIVAESLGLDVAFDDRLQEVDAGEWTGLTRVEIEARWPGYLEAHRRPPGFEDREHLAARALAALGDIAGAAPDETVLVVTHGGVIGAVERHLGAPWERTPNLGGRELRHRAPDDVELGERFLLLDPHDVEVTTPRQL